MGHALQLHYTHFTHCSSGQRLLLHARSACGMAGGRGGSMPPAPACHHFSSARLPTFLWIRPHAAHSSLACTLLHFPTSPGADHHLPPAPTCAKPHFTPRGSFTGCAFPLGLLPTKSSGGRTRRGAELRPAAGPAPAGQRAAAAWLRRCWGGRTTHDLRNALWRCQGWALLR